MNTLICPVSPEKVNSNVVRITGFIVAISAIAYLLTASISILVLLLADFSIRAFSPLKFSPIRYTASKTSKLLRLKPKLINKAPKLFAARVGFLFTIVALLFHPIAPVISIAFMTILLACALLESLFDFCVGCVVYTYVVLPLSKRP